MGGACSRNGAFASIRRPNRPQTTSSHQPTERLSPDTFDDLSHPSDTLLALSVRCVVKNIASPARPTCKAEARRRVHLEQLRHLPSDLSQRIFDELVRTRSLTKEVAANFRGCHLLDARLDAYPGLEDTWLEYVSGEPSLEVLCDVAPDLSRVSLSGCAALTSSGLQHLSACTAASRLDLESAATLRVGECCGVDDRALGALSGMSNLAELTCQGCDNITGWGLRHISGLVALRELNLERCNSLQDSMVFISGLVNLTVLNIGWCNNVSSGDVSSLRGLKNLKSLNLARTRVDDQGAAVVEGFTNLETLNLAGSRITDSAIFTLSNLKKLKSLNLEWCRVTDKGVRQLSPLVNLENLNIAFTAVTSAGLLALETLTKLRFINLDSCQVDDDGIVVFAKWPDLIGADLSDTAVGNAGVKRLASLKHLTRLNLSYSNVSDDGVAYLEDLTSLKSLNLDTRLVTDEGLGYLTKLTQLEELDLFGAKITDDGIAHLKHMPRLTSLELCGGGITDAGVRHLGLACKNLKSLNLGQNFQISNDAVPALILLHDLASLNLTHSRINSEGVSQLGTLRNLTTLALKGCQVSHAAVARLQRECPKLMEVGYGCTSSDRSSAGLQ